MEIQACFVPLQGLDFHGMEMESMDQRGPVLCLIPFPLQSPGKPGCGSSDIVSGPCSLQTRDTKRCGLPFIGTVLTVRTLTGKTEHLYDAHSSAGCCYPPFFTTAQTAAAFIQVRKRVTGVKKWHD